MQLPTVNLNGTSRDQLIERQVNAISYLRKAIQMLQEAAPNARDYTPQGTATGLAAFYRAQQEHVDRLAKLQAVISDLETIVDSL